MGRGLASQPVNAASAPWVLVARRAARAHAPFDCSLLASARREGRVYRIDPVAPDDLAELEQLCQRRAPRVLVVDAGLIQAAGAAAFQHLQRRLPATDCIVGWDAPPIELDATALSRARGCIEWASTPDQLIRALDAVMAGELWFPRAVMESLYLTLIAALAPGAAPTPSADSSAALTARESEVLALMRRGLTNKQIAERLDISANTVKKHLAHVFDKRGLHGRRQEFE